LQSPGNATQVVAVIQALRASRSDENNQQENQATVVFKPGHRGRKQAIAGDGFSGCLRRADAEIEIKQKEAANQGGLSHSSQEPIGLKGQKARR
jgi:hypothetical protein